MTDRSDLEQLRTVYTARSHDARAGVRYNNENPGNATNLDELKRSVDALLSQAFHSERRHRKVLDVGCGTGWLCGLLSELGISPDNYTGLDMMPERVSSACSRYPEARFVVGQVDRLPFADEEFDLACQFVLFSSLLDPDYRSRAAREIDRVLVKGGYVMWYDFWLNPTNRRTAGMRVREISRLFPGYMMQTQRLTLAPPLARWIGDRVPRLLPILARVPVLRTHHLALLRKP